jgi:hypothetical protein
MTQYNIGFAERLIEIARFARGDGTYDFEAAQVVCYLTQLSLELSLKALLEQAGEPVNSIKQHSHRLDDLLTTVGRCEVRLDIVAGFQKYVPATRLRAIQVQGQETVGALISKLAHECSQYPNEIRYGTGFYGLPADTLIELAGVVNRFVKQHWDSVRLSAKQEEGDAQSGPRGLTQ